MNAGGRFTKEIHRCLKRYMVRELYPLITKDLQAAGAATRLRSVNAVMEHFFGSLTSEWLAGQRYWSRQAARRDVIEYIEMEYNSCRPHSTLGYQVPREIERAVAA